MSLETDLRVRLLANATVSGLVSTRVYPNILPQKPTLPALVYSRISGPRIHTLTGTSGWSDARIQIDSWGATYIAAQDLAAAVRASLDGFIGSLDDGNSPAATRRVAVRLDNERDLFEEEPDFYRVTQDYAIKHED